jgi:hypothetical protein
MAGIQDFFGGLLGPVVDMIKGDPNNPRPGVIESIGSRLMGPGAFGDPLETFNMYAPPNVVNMFSPEERVAYGKQIQSQMRKINADYVPRYKDVQEGIVGSLKYGDEARAAFQDLTMKRQAADSAKSMMERDQAALGGIFGGGNMPSDMPNGTQNAGVQTYAIPSGNEDQAPPGELPQLTVGYKPAAGAMAGNPRKANANKYFEAAQYYAREGRPELAKKYHDIGISLDPNQEDAIRSGEYLLGMSLEGSGEAGLNHMKEYFEAKRPSTTVNVTNNAPQAKGDVKYWEALAGRIPQMEAQATSADRTNLALRDMIDMSSKGTFSGMLAPGAIGASQFLQSFGLNPGDKLANTREFQASANILVLDFMGAMGGARGFSKEESQILYDAFPKIIDDPKARERIARMLITRNNRVINEYKAAVRQYEGGGGGKLPPLNVEPLELGATPSKSLDEIFKK